MEVGCIGLLSWIFQFFFFFFFNELRIWACLLARSTNFTTFPSSCCFFLFACLGALDKILLRKSSGNEKPEITVT